MNVTGLRERSVGCILDVDFSTAAWTSLPSQELLQLVVSKLLKVMEGGAELPSITQLSPSAPKAALKAVLML